MSHIVTNKGIQFGYLRSRNDEFCFGHINTLYNLDIQDGTAVLNQEYGTATSLKSCNLRIILSGLCMMPFLLKLP